MNIEKKHIYYIILLFVVILAISPWLREGIPTTDDFRGHLAHFYHVKHSLENGKMPIFMMNELYSGFPIFYFYSTLPYFISIPFIISMNVVTALKYSIILSFFVAAISMYVASKILFKDDDIALISSVAYTFFSYHFMNAGTRGAFNELWGYSIFPLALMFLILSIDNPSKKNMFFAILLSAAMILIHIPSAYMLFLTFGLYLIYKCIIEKKIKIYTIKTAAIIFLVIFLLVAFWLVPFLADSKYANFSHQTTKNGHFVFFGQISPDNSVIGLSELVGRNFGAFADGQIPFYLGIALMLLFLAGFLYKNKYAKFFMCTALFFILVNATTFLMFIIPLGILLQFKFRFFLIISVTLCLAAGVNAKALINLIKTKKNTALIKLFLVIAVCFVIVVDFYPLLNKFNWVSQKDEYFINRPSHVDVMKKIAAEPGYFVVFSPQAQAAYMYHKKFELGYDWEGQREGAVGAVQNSYTQAGFDFLNSLKSKDLIKLNKTSQSLGYFGVKYIVLNCIDGFERIYPIAYTNKVDCVYSNPFYRPIIEVENGAENIVFDFGKTSFDMSTQNDTFAIVKIANFEGHYAAYVDGKEAAIETVWPKYMKIGIPKGNHTVNIIYRNTKLQVVTKIISTLTLIALIMYYFSLYEKVKIINKKKKKKDI